MSIFAALRVALAALAVNKGRSVLTSLGIVIGIMAVIAMVAAGNGARELLDDRLIAVGKNLILISPGNRTATGVSSQTVPLTSEDTEAIRSDPQLQSMLEGVAETQQQLTIASTTTELQTSLVGSIPVVLEIRGWKMAQGRKYNMSDVKQAASVCLIGETVRKSLLPHRLNPLGQQIRVQGVGGVYLNLTVIGVLGLKGRGPTGFDQDNQIFLPITTLQNKLAGGGEQINVVVAAAKDQRYIQPAKQRIEHVLRKRHRLRGQMPNDFEVNSVEEMANIAVIMTNVLNTLVVVIAAISLVVGGIGIMNIMLVSVTERTREIGIRMAVGATPNDIRRQFLLEAMVLALIGGIIGVVLGISAAASLSYFLKWPVYYSPLYVAIAFLVSALVGIFFGFYPAAKASQLDPIEALRYE